MSWKSNEEIVNFIKRFPAAEGLNIDGMSSVETKVRDALVDTEKSESTALLLRALTWPMTAA